MIQHIFLSSGDPSRANAATAAQRTLSSGSTSLSAKRTPISSSMSCIMPMRACKASSRTSGDWSSFTDFFSAAWKASARPSQQPPRDSRGLAGPMVPSRDALDKLLLARLAAPRAAAA
eukprot:CAMPEP_0180748502 /NCGR_PEP_ID=MMETSP1038_2-20121128/30091_1 /TAXON_ID=632150 /ORGANISM="Azadinium spinosum, Strain 3D9" /LENGTH=117 /DNA_ID=CAMNT_0022782141 /DNA_START=451 /DNA_END=804 /DNA_ORIENTATION=+